MTRPEPQPPVPTSPEEDAYVARTPESGRLFSEGRRYLPGADSRTPLFHRPYPAVMVEGRGARVRDIDGNDLVDFTSNHSTLPLGNADERVLAAVKAQLDRGTSFPGPTVPQITFARKLCERIPSFEQVRFTSSGTEAVLQAYRAARAFTGRGKIVKVEGGYNGSFDAALVSNNSRLEQVGDAQRPAAVAGSSGLAPGTVENVVVVPFNDVATARRLIEEQAAEIAGVVVEPVMGSAGMIAAEPAYLEMLREVTRRHGMLLIFDEVISLRVAYGGAQEHYGVTPDLTCLGKAIGGGFPLGVFGGRADVMALYDPTQDRPRPPIPHPGSLNANPVSLVAGETTFDVLDRAAIAELNRRGAAVREGLAEAISAAGHAVQVTGLGSLFAIHFTDRPVRSYRDMLASDPLLRHRLFLALYTEGVLIDPRGVGCASLATGDAEIEALLEAVRTVVPRLAG
ncbi:MAG TPA: aspartate aminotransferase family protein, partial [Solirubrobacteraceae bacterium]